MRKALLPCVLILAALATPAVAAGVNFGKVDAIFKRTPIRSGDVYRYAFPRSDLDAAMDGVKIEPALALTGWVAFVSKSASQPSVSTGELVLAEAEVEPAMKTLLAGGIEVTALSVLPRATPPIYELRIAGRGDPAEAAKTILSALERTKTPLDVARTMPKSGLSPAQPLDIARIERALGAKAHVSGGVYQFHALEPAASSLRDASASATMGGAGSINFQPTGRGAALVVGELAVRADEIGTVAGELLAHDVQVTAIYSRMTTEEPRRFFVQFFANGDALGAAEGVRAALDRIAAERKHAKTEPD